VDAIAMTHIFALSGVAKASVADIPFIGAIALALQFLFVQRRGGTDAKNKYTQTAGSTVDKISERSQDCRCACHKCFCISDYRAIYFLCITAA
jgi:1-acyl-sn-glycerol-3-phosphate acyltransferase